MHCDEKRPLLTRGTGSSVWLKQWSEHNQKAGGNDNVGMYIGIYFAFGIGSSLLMVVQTLILWIFCSIEVQLHTKKLSLCDVTDNGHNRLHGNFTNAWRMPSSDLRCHSSIRHLPGEFSTGSLGSF